MEMLEDEKAGPGVASRPAAATPSRGDAGAVAR